MSQALSCTPFDVLLRLPCAEGTSQAAGAPARLPPVQRSRAGPPPLRRILTGALPDSTADMPALTLAQCELKRLITVARGVKLGAVGQGAHVVHCTRDERYKKCPLTRVDKPAL